MLLAGSTQAVRWGNGVVLKKERKKTSSLLGMEGKAYFVLLQNNMLCDNSINLSQISTRLQTTLTGTFQLWVMKKKSS